MIENSNTPHIWDTVVVGGGPAGMLAAGRAAERGQGVILLEKNSTLGRKLLITGGGRCNITNNKPDPRTLLPNYKDAEPYLYSAFSQCSVLDALTFFNSRGVATKEEAEGRMFPQSNKSQSVWDALVSYVKEGGVVVETGVTVTGIVVKDGLFILRLRSGKEIMAKTCIVAAGGTSRPETGSTGDGFAWAKSLGHAVVENKAALVPIALHDSWTKKLAGVSLPGIKLTVFQDGIKQQSHRGKLLFTHVGVSGPTVLNISRDIGELLQYGEVVLMLDLLPNLDYAMLKVALQELLIGESNKKIKNSLGKLIPPSLVPAVLTKADIAVDTPNHSVKREERMKLIEVIKSVPLHVAGLLGTDKAVVSSGGVDPKEINFKTMESRVVPGLYIVGDMLDIDRPSGGYSLQLCWTTGYIAGSNA